MKQNLFLNKAKSSDQVFPSSNTNANKIRTDSAHSSVNYIQNQKIQVGDLKRKSGTMFSKGSRTSDGKTNQHASGQSYSTNQTITAGGSIKHQGSFFTRMQTLLQRKERRESESGKSNNMTTTTQGDQQVKTADEKKKEEAALFVMQLYDRVHTQSAMLQQQMTMNIINEIKIENRVKEKPSKMSITLARTKKNLVPLKWFALFILLVLPIFKMPAWCISADFYDNQNPKNQCENDIYINSDIYKLPPWLNRGLYMLSYCILAAFIIMRLSIKKITTSVVVRSTVMLLVLSISFVDLLIVEALATRETTFFTEFINVLIILFFIRAIREVWIQIIKVLIASFPVLIICMAFIVVSCYAAYILFGSNPENDSFENLPSSLYTVFQMFTMSNYPDIEIPFFETYRQSAIYFVIQMTVGIFLLSNLLLATVFNNYKTALNRKMIRYEEEVGKYFQRLFEKIDYDKQGFITTQTMVEALGGDVLLMKDKRTFDLIWQANIILDGEIRVSDFRYIMQHTATTNQQQLQLSRVRRYIRRKELEREKKARKAQMIAERIANKRATVGRDLQQTLAQSLGFKVEKDLEKIVQAEEDDALIDEIRKQNRKICFFFKRKIKADLEDRIRDQMRTSEEFKKKLEALGKQEPGDLQRIMSKDKYSQQTGIEKQHIEKEEYSNWRKWAIRYQNKYWADVPLTVVSIVSLLFIPLFQYCHDSASNGQKEVTLLLALVWCNFVISWIYLFEIVTKVFAFGIRRAFSSANWAIKCEFFFQPIVLFYFIFFCLRLNDLQESTYETEGNIICLGILLRSLRITFFMRELKIWRNFIRAMQALIRPFTNLAMALYSLYLIYAAIGVAWFGGKINTDSIKVLMDEAPDIISYEWVYLNFNDFIMAMNTLFGFMWQNDWEQLVFMYQLALKHENDGLVLLFFISFMQMTNLLFLNIIIAFVIDTYTSIEETLQQEKQQREIQDRFQERIKYNDDDKSLLRELNDNPGQFTRIMQILNSKNDDQPSPKQIRVSKVSSIHDNEPSIRGSMLSEHSKQKKKQNEQELGSFYRKLRDGMQNELSEDEDSGGSDGTSELLTEFQDVGKDELEDNEEDEMFPKGSIYQKKTGKNNSKLRRARTGNMNSLSTSQNQQKIAGIERVNERDDEEDSEDSPAQPKRPIGSLLTDIVHSPKGKDELSSSYKHWDQALINNVRKDEVEKQRKSKEEEFKAINESRIVSDIDGDKTDEEEKDGWFKE